ncbi:MULTISPECIES: hypothetical protein [Methylobacterium]|jgi:hypothetical protein|uniref:hypothetical protein n=1 Tax=Methylobacterium TaxID=407 RepID=UPI0008E794D0|nr:MULTISPECIES: hypothetical protein [Methylobacterium]MBZ6413423.1 hypothetical protein [Methylobacterium sp.]MBK3397910.1 hypothetical protein [Methylobacterium ajmalii]MBK3408800.1 hypothetical protein [Methylobacterium ajmalii]MBK3422046.1 hypothetical protein [Methylobacterium ajmalii]SFE83990.1 hypothetical protein SAMN04487844_106194 [Methylobacterium sp. yr596]
MEQVVIVDPDKANAGTWSALLQARKTQEFSDRVFVVEAEKPVIDALRALPGVKTPAQLDPASTAGLSLVERLSLSAWAERTAGMDKPRTGNGLNWGHKGFQAP